MGHVASRYHDISTGHRVFGHEGKCAHLHGHNYRIHFDCASEDRSVIDPLDKVGRVVDFSVIKEALCLWLEENWDHKFLIWREDPWASTLLAMDPDGVVIVAFNPTAENMAKHLLLISDVLFANHDEKEVRVVKVTIEETRKCSASYTLPNT